MKDKNDDNGSYMSSVNFKRINSSKTCHIESLDYELAFHASAVTPMGVITCGGMSPLLIERKKCFRLSNQNTWESFPSMNNDHNSCFNSILSFQMIVLGDILVAIDSKFRFTFGKLIIIILKSLPNHWMGIFVTPCNVGCCSY